MTEVSLLVPMIVVGTSLLARMPAPGVDRAVLSTGTKHRLNGLRAAKRRFFNEMRFASSACLGRVNIDRGDSL
jgi:hypothetical protein